MPPKKQTARVDHVDGVHYTLNLASNLVVVGTGVVSNHERDMFRWKTQPDSPSLAEQIRARPKWASILAAQLSSSGEQHASAVPAPRPVGERELRTLLPAPVVAAHRTSVQPDFFMHSEDSVRDDYKSQHLGSRHGAVRDVSYAEAVQRLEQTGLEAEAWLFEVRTIVLQMDIIIAEIPPEHATVALVLQEALMGLLGEAEGDSDGEEGEPECEPCTHIRQEGDGASACGQCESDEPCESSAPNGSNMIDAEKVATAFFQEVAEAVG